MTVDEVLGLYRRWGVDRYDEQVTQLEHALQTAAAALAAGSDDSLVAAALLHDVGHLLDLETTDGGRPVEHDLRHEAVGARYLAQLFPPSVTGPVALHVRAKRYLCATDPGYHDRLSDGSKRSLARQGGPMSAEEAAAFLRLAGGPGAVQLRIWDDEGKVLDRAVPPLDDYRPLLDRLASG